MTTRSWPTLSFARRLLIFYLVVWLGSGALALTVLSFWFQPFYAGIFAQQLVIAAFLYLRFRYAWRRIGRPDMSHTIVAVLRRFKAEAASIAHKLSAFFVNYGLRTH